MAKSKQKYYTVWKGHRTGVFESWEDCKAQIANFEGAQYKSFLTFQLAKTALKGDYKDYVGKSKKLSSNLSESRLKLIGQPNYNSISVDAASSGNPGIMEYRGVDTHTKKQLFHWHLTRIKLNLSATYCIKKIVLFMENEKIYNLNMVI